MSGSIAGVATTTTITFGGTTYNVASAPIEKPKTREAVNVTTLADIVMKYVAGAVENWDSFSITVYDSGSEIDTSTAEASFSVSSTITDGTNSSSVSVSFAALLTNVTPGSIEYDGDRRATLELTFQPTGNAVTAGSSQA